MNEKLKTAIFLAVAAMLIIPAPIVWHAWMTGRDISDAIYTCHC